MKRTRIGCICLCVFVSGNPQQTSRARTRLHGLGRRRRRYALMKCMMIPTGGENGSGPRATHVSMIIDDVVCECTRPIMHSLRASRVRVLDVPIRLLAEYETATYMSPSITWRSMRRKRVACTYRAERIWMRSPHHTRSRAVRRARARAQSGGHNASDNHNLISLRRRCGDVVAVAPTMHSQCNRTLGAICERPTHEKPSTSGVSHDIICAREYQRYKRRSFYDHVVFVHLYRWSSTIKIIKL